MIKIIQYMHGSSAALLEAAAVAAWSMKTFGGFREEEVKLIFYTTTPENLDNPFLHEVFDEVKEPTFDWKRLWALDWASRPSPNYAHGIHGCENNRRQICWTKYVQWVEEPCEPEDYVLFGDMDVLCVGSLTEALPTPEEDRLWAGVPYRMRHGGKTRVGVNGGFYAKRGAFNQTDLRQQLQEIVWDDEKYSFSHHRLCPHIDESAAAWFLHTYGYSTFKWLDSRFNFWNKRKHIRRKQTLEQCDIRIMHYVGGPKPWDALRKPFKALCNRWRTIRDRMNETLRPEKP